MKTWEKIRNYPELKNRYFIREKVVDTIRAFFKNQGFHEVSTPILVPTPSAESNLEVFETELRTKEGTKRRGFLIMSPEYSLKKLISAGFGNIFEITKSFRNEEEVSRLHNPEFTMLEWYRVGANYKNIMEDFEKLFLEIIKVTRENVDLKNYIYQGENYDVSLPWIRITVAECFEKYAGIDTETLLSEEKLLKKAEGKGYSINNSSWEQVFYQIFFNEIEPKLKATGKPAFVYDYPLSQAALSKVCDYDSRFAERFELFFAGLELGNCFSELTDPAEQEARFKSDLALRKQMGKTEYGIDQDFITALKTGMPEVAGIAVGVDRLVMLASDAPTISDTLLFPAGELFELTTK